MNIYASTKTPNNDPAPYVWSGRSASFDDPDLNGENWESHHAPRPEFDMPRTHEGNPILIAARENWDNDPWGQSLAWIDALENYSAGFGYANATDAESWGASYERIQVWHLAENTGEWDLPQATPEHIEHAARVFDRMADVTRAAGLDY